MKAKDLNLKEGDVVKNGISLIDYKVTFQNGELHIGSRAPKLWRDMTPEEKGALLLSYHEGKDIEYYDLGRWVVTQPWWSDDFAYRVKPEPKVETKIIHYNSYVITFNLIDGEPDCASVNMEKIK